MKIVPVGFDDLSLPKSLQHNENKRPSGEFGSGIAPCTISVLSKNKFTAIQ